MVVLGLSNNSHHREQEVAGASPLQPRRME